MLASIPMVSIILPTFNRARLLPNAINSVLAQTFENWELIIWDDGSVDDTKKVVGAYQDKRIAYYYEVNRGKPYALNQAIRKALGEFIAFLDDDDQWVPTKLDLQLSVLNENPEVGLIFGNFLNIDQVNHKEGIGFTQNTDGLKQLSFKSISKGCSIIKEGFLKGISKANFIASDTVIIRKEALSIIGPFNETLMNSEDFEFWWRFGLTGYKAAFTEEILLKREKYSGSLSSSSLATIENHLKALDSCARNSVQNDCTDTMRYLNPQYRNAWQNKILIYGQKGEKRMAWKSFMQSLRYGFRPGSARLLLFSILGKFSP